MLKARTDANQTQVVNAFRMFGCSVQHLHTIGKGCPDILVGYKGKNYLFEIKDGDKPQSQRRLTEDEMKWHKLWTGQVKVIDSVDFVKRFIDDPERWSKMETIQQERKIK